MNRVLRSCLAVALASAAGCAGSLPAPRPGGQDDRLAAAHALDRLAFGARPGDRERVERMGVDRWIDLQLHPERIDERALEERLARFRALELGGQELLARYPTRPLLQDVSRGERPMPGDPSLRAIYEDQLAGEQGAEAGATGPAVTLEELADLPAAERLRRLLALPPSVRLELLREARGPARRRLLDGLEPEERDLLAALESPRRALAEQAAQARLLRDVNAERQLLEVMTDFWLNHFNVYAEKGPDRWLLVELERDVLRAHALGRFRDLLGATARSPAMLFYLDNWLSAGPSSLRARRHPGAGLNENYARELLELHTLGAEAGYTQRDVVEVARCFTGWTIERPFKEGRFVFDPRMHDPGDKLLLGHRIAPGGEQEGEEVLDLLARDPRTARRIALKLAERFVSDDPPDALVERLARRFTASDGDVRAVLVELFHAPEFWDPSSRRAKLKTPLELVVSAARASGAEVEDAGALAAALGRMGMPLYGMATPNGWAWTAAAWGGPGALLERFAFARALATNRLPGVRVAPGQLAGGEPAAAPEAAQARLEEGLLAGEVSRSTHAAVAEALADPRRRPRPGGDPLELAVALLLSSPEFQRR